MHVGASGGLDSSYVIYVAKKLLGLNPLVVKYDHGFNFEIANKNIQTLCNNLGVDLKIIKSAQGNDAKCLKYRIKALRKLGSYWGICTFYGYACIAVVHRQAIENNVSIFLASSNLYELADLSRSFKMASTHRAFRGLNILDLAKIAFYLAISEYYLLRLKMEFYVPPINNLFKRQPRLSKNAKPYPVTWFNITEYVGWDIDKMVKTLENETGWKAPEPPRLPMRFDCIIEEGFVNHTHKKTAGSTIHGVISNRLIAAGIRTKDDLKETIDYYDKEIAVKMKEMEEFFGLSSEQKPGGKNG